MNTITSILEGFEKLAYKFLLAVIFIPKTIVQITVNPGWVPGYVKGELNQEKSPFDEFLSPVILLLVVALIPAIIINFLPTLGTTLTSMPAENEDETTRFIKYEAETKIISGNPEIYNQYTWWVERINVGENNDQSVAIYRETYNEKSNKTVIEEPGKPPKTIDGTWNTELIYPNDNYNTTKVTFHYRFAENTDIDIDEYYVNFDMVTFDPLEIDNEQGENYFDQQNADIFNPLEPRHAPYILEHNLQSLYIVVPAPNESDQRIVMPQPDARGQSSEASKFNLSDLLKKETTIFLALGLLFPPLVFALASKLFGGEEISEKSLRESFYSQCYYFSPLSLAIWATYYAGYFTTPDVFFYRGDSLVLPGIIIPAFLAVLWFIGTETYAIAEARSISASKAFFVAMFCVTLLLFAGYQVYQFTKPYSSIEDVLRRLAILLYPLGAVVLVAGFLYVSWKKRKADGKKITKSDFVLWIVHILIVVGAIGILVLVGSPTLTPAPSPQDIALPTVSSPDASTASLLTQASPTVSVSSPPTETPTLEVQPFYTEEFNDPSEDWFSFLTSGIESQINMVLEDGKLVFSLTPFEDKIPEFYFINSAFVYDDVRVDAVVTNTGNNSNGASLICRYNDFGWYEFTVSNAGLYEIYAFDASGAVNGGFNMLANGGSSAIKTGNSTNTYTGVCAGNTLSLYVNDVEVRTITDTEYNFTEGMIGIGVSSPDTLPVNLQFESLDVRAP